MSNKEQPIIFEGSMNESEIAAFHHERIEQISTILKTAERWLVEERERLKKLENKVVGQKGEDKLKKAKEQFSKFEIAVVETREKLAAAALAYQMFRREARALEEQMREDFKGQELN